jgi:hypothetical protein
LTISCIEVARDLSSSIKEVYSAAAPLVLLRATAMSCANCPTAMKSPIEMPNGRTISAKLVVFVDNIWLWKILRYGNL